MPVSTHKQPTNPYSPLKNAKIYNVCSVLFVLFAWSVASYFVSKNILPSPLACLKAFVYLAWNPEKQESMLLNATIASISRVVFATVLVIIAGLPLGVLMGSFPKINAILSPLIDPFRSAPIAALLPIFMMWFGIGEGMKIAFLFAASVVYFVPMVRDAIQAVPSIYWISAVDLGATSWETIKYSLIPIALPRIADAVVTTFSIMFTYLCVSEAVNAQDGLGLLIEDARRFSAMDQVFVGIFVIIGLALLNYKVLVFLKNKLFPWELA